MIDVPALHHYAIAVRDIEASASWYKKHFGFTVERRFGFPEASTYIAHLFHPSGVRVELLQTAEPNDSPDKGLDAFGAIKNLGSKHIGLLVTDLRKAEQYVKSQDDIQIIHEYTEVEPAGVKNLWVLDNDGNHVELVEWLH